MYTVLQKAGITPGKQYNITEIWDGVKKVLTKDPQVACYEDVSLSFRFFIEFYTNNVYN